ncbi:MAG: ABC-2 family transporter protein, partial [Chloroflexi bacterium]|nr:ABC-2 family transporter protein [Chloroflexota bacterium]
MLLQLRRTTTKYAAITMTNLQNQLAYVWEALNRAVFIVLIMFVFIQLWTAVYESQGATEIAGLSLAATIWYFLIAEVMELGKIRHDERISEEVKDGSVAYTLTRPYNYLAYHFFNGLGETAVKMTLIFLLGL